MTDASVYNEARAAVASMLGYDLGVALSPEQSTRFDICTALRIAVDAQSGMLARNETTDVTRLLSASEALAKLLPPLREPPPANAPDPREHMWRVYKQMRDRGEIHGEGYDGKVRRIAELEAKVAELEAQLAERTAASVPPPLPDNVVALRPSPTAPSGAVPSVPPSRSAPVAPAAPPAGGLLTDAVDEPWRPFVGGGAHYDRWGNHN